MSAANEPLRPSATIEVDLSDLTVSSDNSFRIWVRFEGGDYLSLDIQPDSDGHREILDTLADVVGTRLTRLGDHGIVITGLTTVDTESEGADDE